MTTPAPPRELIDHLCRHSRLTEAEAEHVVIEVLSFYTESRDDFIRRRHRELQQAGLANAVIFERMIVEVARWRFIASTPTERQIRRVIYG